MLEVMDKGIAETRIRHRCFSSKEHGMPPRDPLWPLTPSLGDFRDHHCASQIRATAAHVGRRPQRRYLTSQPTRY